MAQENAAGEILFAFSEEFNSGVVGLAAARLVDTYYRPAIVGSIEGETARASCRSIPEFHITHALDECKDLLVRHGGHSVAAGFTVRTENMAELQRRLSLIAGEQLGGKELIPTIQADAEVNLSQMRSDDVAVLIRHLDGLQPTGQENPEAAFVSRGLRVVRSRTVGADSSHLKLSLNDGRATWDAIAFRQGKWHNEMPEAIDVFYAFERNVFNNTVTLQLNVRDLKPAI
jgi:single-stranded-DNA-specific exonuclease